MWEFEEELDSLRVWLAVQHSPTTRDVAVAFGWALTIAAVRLRRVNAHRGWRLDRPGRQRLQDDLFEAIAHGDTEHRAWLKSAINDFFSGREA